LNGKKTYGVVNKDKEADNANLYESQGEQEEGIPSFEFVEVAPRTLPPKTLIQN
jgi:hypothetical protein